MKVICPNHGKVGMDVHIHQDDERIEHIVCDKCHEEVKINGEVRRYRMGYERV